MGKLLVFNFITLNGFYKGANEDISWHRHSVEGSEESEYGNEGASSGSILLFGRITYDMMASFWPTDMAKEMNPVMAKGMNESEKILFSRTAKTANWSNTKIINSDIGEAVKKLKEESNKQLTILGSGSIVTQLAEKNLIDEFQFMIDPVALGKGTPVFNHISHKLDLQLIDSRIFKSGTVLLTYKTKQG